MVNKVTLVGRVGKTPEVKEITNGKVANILVATEEKWKDKNGEKQSKTEWHTCVTFGNLSGVVESYVNKGDLIYIEGSLTTRKWTDKDGNDRYNTEIKVQNLTMLGGNQKQGEPKATAVSQGYPEDDLPF